MITFVLSLLGLLLVALASGVIGFIIGAYCAAKALAERLDEIVEDEKDREKLKKIFDKL